jgi:hypothetical protein
MPTKTFSGSGRRRNPCGHQVSIRIEVVTLMVFDPDTRELLRTRPNPLSYDQARKLGDARPAGPPPRPSVKPVTVEHRSLGPPGVILVAGQNSLSGGRMPTPSRPFTSPSTPSRQIPRRRSAHLWRTAANLCAVSKPTAPMTMANRRPQPETRGHHRSGGAICGPACDRTDSSDRRRGTCQPE